MKFRASTKFASLVLFLVGACAGGDPPAQTKRFGQQPSSAAGGSSAPTPTTPTPGPTTPSPDTKVDNGMALLPPPPVIAPDAGQDCKDKKDGKFCENKEPDPMDCGSLAVKTTTKTVTMPGNIMMVYDRSTSMEMDWGGMPRYQAAGTAIVAALTPLKDLLTVAAEFFPSLDPKVAMGDANCPAGCNVADPFHWIPGPGACCLNIAASLGDTCYISPISAMDQIPFGPAQNFLNKAPMLWRFPATAIGQTPLEGGVAEAAKAIAATKLTGATNVIIITDGEPNCMTNTQNVINQVAKWKMMNINTYVVGLPGSQGAADLLNQLAVMGGTMAYIDPKNAKDLETRLSAVLMSTVRQGFDSCTFKLDPKTEVPEKLHLLVTQNGMEADVKRDLSKDAHWKINAAGDSVELEGQLCDFAKNGTFESLRFVYGCVVAPPLPPPPPIMIN